MRIMTNYLTCSGGINVLFSPQTSRDLFGGYQLSFAYFAPKRFLKNKKPCVCHVDSTYSTFEGKVTMLDDMYILAQMRSLFRYVIQIFYK